MSLINEYRTTESAIQALQQRLQEMAASEDLAKELEFEGRLRELLAEYNKNLRDVINIIDPQSRSKPAPAPAKVRSPRALKRYKNPHDGSVIETKGGNHKQLKAWKQQYGADEVESWLE